MVKEKWGSEEVKTLKNLCESCKSFKILRETAEEVMSHRNWASIKSKVSENPEWTQHFEDRRTRSRIQTIENKAEPKPTELLLTEKIFSKPVVWDIDKEAFERPGHRIGFLSGIDYKSEGFRAGLIKVGFDLFRQEGTHFNVLNGGLVSKQYIATKIKEKTEGVRREFRDAVINNILNEAAQELSSIIPKIKKPSPAGDGSYVRLYIMTSLQYDGEYGGEIARRLQALRPDDIRYYKHGGGHRIEVKQRGKEKNKVVWTVNPKKSRLPSKYHSTAAEREIDDKRGQTTKDYPDLWVAGVFASSIHKPDGERGEAYITLQALRRLEEVHVAENQIGVTVVEYTSDEDEDDDRFVRAWDLKDAVANELMNITGIKSGANEIHRNIVNDLKISRPTTIGLLSDKLGIDRKTIEEEIKFLVEPEKTTRKTWPGLFEDKASQRYDFHLDWLQDELTYPRFDAESFLEDKMLFFSCPHVGYVTTDYQYMVEEMPRRILKHDIEILVGLGDFIAGLHHEYLKTGEVFGNLNNTEQEKFAAEIMGTVLMKVFDKRFEAKLKACKKKKITREKTEEFVKNSLPLFIFIPGNHDLWQLREGSTPLEIFEDKLKGLLIRYISAILARKGLPAVDIFSIVNRKILKFHDYEAVFTLPSGLKLEMVHPHMARAKTTSLRAQEALDVSESQIIGIGNFHTAIVMNKWYPDRGQTIVVQAGAIVTYTTFEKRKLKKIDFGTIYLRTLSKNKRIVMTETAYFDKPCLYGSIPKWTNLDQLKEELNILSAN